MLRTRFTDLVGCEVPIQQAGMGGVAMPPLVHAVSAAGGVGTLGGVMIPPPALAAMLDHLRAQTDRPFGVNFLIPFVDPEAVRIAASRARIVEFFFGEPDTRLVELVHAGGALACWQVGSRAEAIAAEGAGCDLIIAQGVEAGGHVRGTIGLLPLLDQVLAAVAVPVIAAGGITTGRSMAAALAAGAEAVRVGTRFVAAEESVAHPEYVQALLAAQAEDALYTETFSKGWPPPSPHRVLRSCIEAARAGGDEGEVIAQMALGEARIPVPRYAPNPPTLGTTGELRAMAQYAGQGVGSVTRRQAAGEIVREMAAEAEGMLHRWGS